MHMTEQIIRNNVDHEGFAEVFCSCVKVVVCYRSFPGHGNTLSDTPLVTGDKD